MGDSGDMLEFREIHLPDRKTEICNEILRALPDWFGIEESIVEYVNEVKTAPFFTAFDDGKAIGFAALKLHSEFAAEVLVMGIFEKYHRRGIGRRLIAACEDYCKENAIEFLTVKTLDELRDNDSYDKTRRFYQSMGFKKLETFSLLWDESNPCLFMVKYIGV